MLFICRNVFPAIFREDAREDLVRGIHGVQDSEDFFYGKKINDGNTDKADFSRAICFMYIRLNNVFV